MRSGFLCSPNVDGIYRKEFIFFYHINLDIFKICMTVWWETDQIKVFFFF